MVLLKENRENNALYTLLTDKPSVLSKSGPVKDRRIMSGILLAVGLFTIVTVLLGYGLNGYPLLDWSDVFSK